VHWHHGHPWWNSQAQGGERSRRRHSYKNKSTHKLREHCKTLNPFLSLLSQHGKTQKPPSLSLSALQNPKSLSPLSVFADLGDPGFWRVGSRPQNLQLQVV
jgi:hypothetical protein